MLAEEEALAVVEPVRKWKPPEPMFFKCNTDASWDKESRRGGAGWLLRDHQGSLLWAGVRKMTEVRSAIEAEAESIRWAVQVLVGFRYRQVLVETDSLQLTRMLNGEDAVWPVLERIIQDISSSLSRHGGITVGYYPRCTSCDQREKEEE